MGPLALNRGTRPVATAAIGAYTPRRLTRASNHDARLGPTCRHTRRWVRR